jgi:hypothetical protein
VVRGQKIIVVELGIVVEFLTNSATGAGGNPCPLTFNFCLRSARTMNLHG